MNKTVSNIFRFIILILIQVLIFNHISLWGYLTPYPYLYFILLLRKNISNTSLLLTGFLTGLTVDIFQNTLGMQAAAATLVAFARPYVIKSYFRTMEFTSDEIPGINKLKFGGFFKYTFTLVFIHSFTVYILETLSVHNFSILLKDTLVNALITTMFIIIFELFAAKRSKR